MPAPERQNGEAQEHLAAALVSLAAALLMTWPLAAKAGHQVLDAIYYWDAYTNTMLMGSRVDGLFGLGPLSLRDSYFYAPLPDSIVFNENHYGLSLIFAPFYLASGNPLWAYNVTLLLSLALSAFFTYLLVRRLTGSGYAGVIAGVAFALSPYVTFEIGRIQLVATQWIPACFLMLHRAVCDRRLRDVVGLWLCYLLQIGTCLYYAMFLIPLLTLAGAVLLWRERPPRRQLLQLLLGGVVSGVVALWMVYPYFSSRDAFSLERTADFASGYDGKLAFFANVHPTNQTLTSMHHVNAAHGAFEEIAFPGFTVSAALLLALLVPLGAALRSLGLRRWLVGASGWLLAAVVAFGASLLTHSMLAGLLVIVGAATAAAWRGLPNVFAGVRGLHLALMLLSVGLFFGLYPGNWDGQPVHGIYYYLHTHFPGFDGIRKVSRQAVMTTFCIGLLASHGSAWLVGRMPRRSLRMALTAALLLLTCYELRVFPHPMRHVWAGERVPEAYRYLADRDDDGYVAVTPPDDGARIFRGYRGMAVHNYMALYHKHRTLNGKSTWIPPVADLAHRALRFLPAHNARRILEILDARYILVHEEDLPRHRRGLPRSLQRQPAHYTQLFSRGGQWVFELKRPRDVDLSLVDLPALPAGAVEVPQQRLRADADLRPDLAQRALDGSQDTRWSGLRHQSDGQFFELRTDRPRDLVAVEFENHGNRTHFPLGYEVSVAEGEGPWRAVYSQPQVRIFRELVYAPRDFVFRVALPEPVRADRLRVTILEGMPGRYFSIHEARLYEAGR